ncbi:hypothetical protein GCM10022393_19970 [Aquimarina addita]|uniref:DUF454 family protein n=1 Tax=Aquimarina addita TaxID=870485 RepID=A0ABP6UKT8_9FLAO
MKKSIFKPIIIGILLGAFVFFTGPLLFVILILKFIFTPFGMGRMMWRNKRMGMPPFAFADKIRSMSDEQFDEFKSQNQRGFYSNQYC